MKSSVGIPLSWESEIRALRWRRPRRGRWWCWGRTKVARAAAALGMLLSTSNLRRQAIAAEGCRLKFAQRLFTRPLRSRRAWERGRTLVKVYRCTAGPENARGRSGLMFRGGRGPIWVQISKKKELIGSAGARVGDHGTLANSETWGAPRGAAGQKAVDALP